MEYREGIDIIRNTSDVKAITFVVNELIKQSIQERTEKQLFLSGVVHWVLYSKKVKPKYNELVLVRFNSGKVRPAKLKEHDNKFYSLLDGKEVNYLVEYFGKMPK
jgi:hypothetical protein